MKTLDKKYEEKLPEFILLVTDFVYFVSENAGVNSLTFVIVMFKAELVALFEETPSSSSTLKLVRSYMS